MSEVNESDACNCIPTLWMVLVNVTRIEFFVFFGWNQPLALVSDRGVVDLHSPDDFVLAGSTPNNSTQLEYLKVFVDLAVGSITRW